VANIFVISDTHFGHANILNFKGLNNEPLRVFDDVNHMDEYMIERWNSVVTPQDKIYHLGDVLVKGSDWTKLGRLNGHKRLLLGNHDYPNMRLYQPYFEDIYSTRLLDKLLLSHIPIHPLSLGKAIANVHGHVHNNVGPDHFGKQYVNVSVEVVDYTPIAWEDLKDKVLKRLEDDLN
jgi:calcineurin-like phosphoesterase family protein